MRLWLSIICLVAVLHQSFAPPVSPEKKEQDSDVKDDLEEYMEYHRYLKEVVQALESDPDFRERLEKADEDDVRTGKIAEQLDFVNHNVRTKLDEIKRRELDRLRHLATKQFELTNKIDSSVSTGNVPTNEHLDHANPHTFEMEDLKRLIKKTIVDLEAADKLRKQEFKEYEMQKEFEEHQKLKEMDEAQKKEYETKLKEEEEAKKHHQPLHHPGSKQQLEEVWEKQDHMDQQFDPKVFFMMHDVDGNGVWDADEVKALFIKELDKLYGPGGPNKDLHERAEEMERMREHVFKENDKNRDGLIDFNEFMMETQKAEFNHDEGWKPIEENQIYTQSEYEEFEKRRLEELKYLQQRGLVDAHGRPVPGAQHQIQQAYQQHQAYQQQQFQQQPPQFHGQQQYYPQGQMPQGQIPQAQLPQGEVPHQYQNVPQQGYQQMPGQVPQYQGQYPPPSQGQFHGQQPPQNQYPGQVPQQPLQNVNVNQGLPIQNQAQHIPAQVQQVPAQAQQVPAQAQQAPVQAQPVPVQAQQLPGQGQQAPLETQNQGQAPPAQTHNQQ